MSTNSNIQSALRIPSSLQLQRVPLQVVLVTALASAVVTIGAVLQNFPLYGIVGLGILPWLPLFFFEAAWKYENYGTYALLGAFVFLQIGHLGEHTVQVLQLWIHDGDLAKSHGVFGALDRELVHFVWDSGVWLGVLWILWKFGPHNKWLWISMIAASFHEVEHVFLYYLDRFQPEFYEAGGSTGILARGGIIGTPFARPYIHYIYNFFVVIPLIVALWDETKRVYNKWLDKALPDLTEQEKISTSTQLDPFNFKAGDVIVRQGDVADRFYIVSDGRVEVVHAKTDGGDSIVATLGPGQFFGEIGLLTGKPRTATVRALEDTRVLSLDQSEFMMLVTRSQGGAADLDAALHTRMAEMTKLGQPAPSAPETRTPAG